MKSCSHSCALAVLLAGTAVASLQAQTFTFNNGGGSGLWSAPANWTGAVAYPNGVGALATMNTGGGFATDLDVNATVSGLRNSAGSARIWTHTNTGGFTLTLDGTGFTNGFGNANTAEIRATSSGGIVSAANLLLSNTNLDIGTVGSNNAAAQVTLSGTITAATNQTITIRNNRRQTNLQGSIGASGAGRITIVNLSSSGNGIGDPNQVNLSGNLGSQVVQLTQGTGVTTGLVVSGANPAFTGDVSVLANSITVGATGTLGNSNVIMVANNATLVLQNATALGTGSALVLEDQGKATLGYSGTLMIDTLSLNGGLLNVPGGSVWGPVGSGAPNESGQLLGTGWLQVAEATSDPDVDDDGLDDAWETLYFGNTTAQTGSGDPDGDGFTNLQEQAGSSNPAVTASTPNDIDGDGLADAWETTYFGSRTAQNGSGDPDGDGAGNLQEYTAGTTPTNAASWPDTDSDGLNDAWETSHFGNLTAATGAGDADSDGASNLAEMTAGSDPTNTNWTPTHSVLAHRWSFDGNLLDSVGTSHATIVDPDSNPAVGGTTTQGASAITLAGGPSASSAAVRLGANLVGGRTTPVTIELWATHNAVMNWGRIFDFGSSITEYLFMSWTQGTNAAQDQVEWVDAGVTNRLSNTNAPYALGVQYHIVLTLTPATYTNGGLASGTRVTWFTAPVTTTGGLVAKGTFDTANTLSSLNDLDDWIGRSLWAGDNVASATYDEVRIWNGALTNDEVNTYQLAGPTAFAFTDNDGDGLSDHWETAYFGNLSQPANGDPDGDGFSNSAEYGAGSNPTVASSIPNDVDGDSLPDDWENLHFGNLSQVASGDPDGDLATNLQEYQAGSVPNNNTSYPDTDFDGLNDAWELIHFGNLGQGPNGDPDDDGYNNEFEYSNNHNPTSYLSSPDSDGDGLPDGWEIHYFKLPGETGLANPGSILPRQDGAGDPDSDSFSNALEYFYVTDPGTASSVPGDYNNDGVNDGPILLAADAVDTNSFSTALHWHDAAAPVGGKAYFVSVDGLRTPTTGDHTFAGDRLVITTRGTRVGALVWKTAGAVTFPLLQLDGALLNQAAGSGAIPLNGNVLVTAASTLWANNGAILVNAALSGSGNLSLTGNNLVTFAGPSTWTGSLNVAPHATTPANNRFTLATTGVMKFVPGATGVTNAITGAGAITLDGQFAIDTSGASSTLGASWTLVATTGGKTYGAGFNVAGFTADAAAPGARKWTSGVYRFDEATGVLSVAGTPLSSLEDWRQTYFGSPANAGNGANAFDADSDGIANLIEYATDTVPTVANSSAPVTVARVGNVLTLTFNHIDDPQLSYTVEASSNLTTWVTVGTYTGFTANGTTTYVDSVDLTAAGVRRFLRLKATP